VIFRRAEDDAVRLLHLAAQCRDAFRAGFGNSPQRRVERHAGIASLTQASADTHYQDCYVLVLCLLRADAYPLPSSRARTTSIMRAGSVTRTAAKPAARALSMPGGESSTASALWIPRRCPAST